MKRAFAIIKLVDQSTFDAFNDEDMDVLAENLLRVAMACLAR